MSLIQIEKAISIDEVEPKEQIFKRFSNLAAMKVSGFNIFPGGLMKLFWAEGGLNTHWRE